MRQRQILVGYAEDHTMVRKALITQLNDDPGIRVVVEAGSGKEFMKSIEALTILPDVCLIDIQMTNMGGLQLISELKKRWPSVRCVVVSGFSDEMTVFEAIRRGALGYLAKSSLAEDVIDAIKTVFTGDYYYSPTASRESFVRVSKERFRREQCSDRDIEFLRYICMEDLSYVDIGVKMGMSYRSVGAYSARLFQTLGVKSRVGLAIAAVQMGLCGLGNPES